MNAEKLGLKEARKIEDGLNGTLYYMETRFNFTSEQWNKIHTLMRLSFQYGKSVEAVYHEHWKEIMKRCD